ncbi:unnamed protein product [Bemisia tabaci]|uniref:Uncharacterized protein n=1 Tax=Bemisia tabaci TaxID=7038 RepID=A0A9P0ACS0_BEMTA|nr:unnamed protein product [Bemisia tabaci]
MEWSLPFLVGEDKFPKFEISENDASVVANADGLGDLPEEAAGLGLAEPFPVPHMRVEVAVRGRENQQQYDFTRCHIGLQNMDIK